ncbi:MAG: molybdopterin molybdotransferase MoeA, partial [Anaerolineaceae bacterium]|nr:molybdopterin molybdotransferase MoeA [Anaerolineaceae bacterium]
IRNSNTIMLAALIEQQGGEAIPLEIAPDQPQTIRERFQEAVRLEVDLIITSAGVSVGAYDFVRTVIEEDGHLNFWRVNMRPGKPVAFGMYQGTPVVGLPGNPVSAFVGFQVFVLPVLWRLSGLTKPWKKLIRAALTHPIESDGRESYLRAVVRSENDQLKVTLTGQQGSGNLFSLVHANALLILPAGVKSLPDGFKVDLILLKDDIEQTIA